MFSSTQTQSGLQGPLIAAQDLCKSYRRGAEEIHALAGISFEIQAGEFAAVVGPSGAGKTTLLNLLGCLDVPTSGSLTIAGQSLVGLSDRALTNLRRKQVGFVFQQFALLPTLTVAENVALPTIFSGRPTPARVEELLRRTRLWERRSHRPHQLSGGEMQRVAIARALINEPCVLLADEPTGNLDSATGAAITSLFHELNVDGLTVIVITHNETLAATAHRQLILKDGRLLTES